MLSKHSKPTKENVGFVRDQGGKSILKISTFFVSATPKSLNSRHCNFTKKKERKKNPLQFQNLLAHRLCAIRISSLYMLHNLKSLCISIRAAQKIRYHGKTGLNRPNRAVRIGLYLIGSVNGLGIIKPLTSVRLTVWIS